MKLAAALLLIACLLPSPALGLGHRLGLDLEWTRDSDQRLPLPLEGLHPSQGDQPGHRALHRRYTCAVLSLQGYGFAPSVSSDRPGAGGVGGAGFAGAWALPRSRGTRRTDEAPEHGDEAMRTLQEEAYTVEPRNPLKPYVPLRLWPVSFSEARQFIAKHHRHADPPIAVRVSVGITDDSDTLRGVGMLGIPKARMSMDGVTAEVVRVATDGVPNGSSMLYGALVRAAWALGYDRVLTYTLPEESGGFADRQRVDSGRRSQRLEWSRLVKAHEWHPGAAEADAVL